MPRASTTSGDLLRSALQGVLQHSGRGIRGDGYLEAVVRVTRRRRDGRPRPALHRSGRGAALRTWQGQEMEFAAADGFADAALAQCRRSLGLSSSMAPVEPAPQDQAKSGAGGTGAGEMGFLATLEAGLKTLQPGAIWDLSLEETRRRSLLVNDLGTAHETRWSWCRLLIKVRDGNGSGASWAGGAPDLKMLQGRFPVELLHRTLARRLLGGAAVAGSRPVCRPATAVLLAAGGGGLLLHEMTHGLEADAVQQEWSPWTTGREQLSPLLTVWDDPSRPGLRGSYRRDDEGSAGDRRLLVRRGQVVGMLGDRRTAAAGKNIRPGHGRRSSWQEWPLPRAANLVVATGEHDFETVRRTAQPLLVIHDLEAGGTDPRSGHVCLTVSDGEWWDGRHCVGPVAGLHLEGNVVEILGAVDRICSDRTVDSGAATCGREGEGVPIAFLTPSVRTRGLQQLQQQTGAT